MRSIIIYLNTDSALLCKYPERAVCMDIQLPIRMNTCVPVDTHNFKTKQFCVCRTLRLIDWHFVIQPKTLIPSHNLWMTGISSLESEC